MTMSKKDKFKNLILAHRRWLYPKNYEHEYQRKLRKVVAELAKITNLKKQDIFDTLRQSRPPPLSKQIVEAIKSLYESTNTTLIALEQMSQMLKQVNNFNKLQQYEVLKSAMGVDIFVSQPELLVNLNEWAAENVRLIKSIPDEYFSDLQGIISRAIQNGDSTKAVAQQIKDLIGVTDKRARLIARDQIATLNGQLTKKRQMSVGISYYIWSDSNDSRVRTSHQKQDGHLYCWKYVAGVRPICPKCGEPAHDPPEKGHPGEEIRCRCVALPVLDTGELSNVFSESEEPTKSYGLNIN